MPYSPPNGFVEPWEDSPETSVKVRFHTRSDCPRVRAPELLRRVDRPYSAARCGGCADFYGNNHEPVLGHDAAR